MSSACRFTMYVCICKAISDNDIKAAVLDGAEDLETIAETLGAGTGCGTCREFTQEVIDSTLAESFSYAV